MSNGRSEPSNGANVQTIQNRIAAGGVTRSKNSGPSVDRTSSTAWLSLLAAQVVSFSVSVGSVMTSGPPVPAGRDASTIALDADLTIEYDEILKTVSDDMAARLEFATLASLTATMLVASVAVAQDLEPRMYSNAPVGLNFIVAGYTYTDGSVSVDPSVPLEDGEIEVQTTGLGYARVLDVLGRSGKIDVIVPYSWLSGSATYQGEPQEREVEGFGDPRLRFSLNVLGAPALSFEEFQHYEQDVIVGVSLQVTAPLGQYDSDRLVEHRHRTGGPVEPEIGISKSWKRLTLRARGRASLSTQRR